MVMSSFITLCKPKIVLLLTITAFVGMLLSIEFYSNIFNGLASLLGFALLAASSAALAISGLPFQGPIAASRVGYKDKKFLLNPSPEQLKESELDLVVAGTKDAVLMVESETTGLA